MTRSSKNLINTDLFKVNKNKVRITLKSPLAVSEYIAKSAFIYRLRIYKLCLKTRHKLSMK